MTERSTEAYVYASHERPSFPGSPYAPRHDATRRIAYALIALLAGAGATFGNGLVNVNTANLAGGMGLYAAEASWLPAIYVAFNACANLMLVKARAQFGIPAVTKGLLACYALAAILQLVLPGFAAAVVIRAVCGLTAAALTTFTTYNLLQVFPLKLRPLALIFGTSLPQLGPPLARLVPLDMLVLTDWQGLYLIELGLALALLAIMSLAPLPPSDRSKAFEPLDFVTIALLLPAAILICSVLGLGRILWWTDTPWLGWALAAAIPLLIAAWQVERRRQHPLLHFAWFSTGDMLRFALVALLVRVALAEQTYGAVGLLTSGGLTNDQLHTLFTLVVIAMLLGMIVAALTLSEQRLPYQIMAASLLIAWGAWMDSGANSLTRPEQLYLSQSLIAFGTTLFIGPALVYGFLRMLSRGPDHMVSFIVLFSVTQNIGGLGGSALLGSYQTVMARAHAQALSEHLLAADPQVAARLAQGSGQLLQALTAQANVLGYNDVSRLVEIFALAVALYLAYRILFYGILRRPVTKGNSA
ncbi:hypothetical protein PMI16_01943 [Herbaspirillum sp. CF444]|uniref:hypothetical protein n=1 Tax=Herbaspirillum sp. CF444 TaxID=1144319 RepID=UPI0002724BC5|nr:hypothetical protein [Herbaspirillum sp. CF444]EJL89751.1 hypothetical protein PMI16_01943 [Herbaspirillum sp. CF444]